MLPLAAHMLWMCVHSTLASYILDMRLVRIAVHCIAQICICTRCSFMARKAVGVNLRLIGTSVEQKLKVHFVKP